MQGDVRPIGLQRTRNRLAAVEPSGGAEPCASWLVLRVCVSSIDIDDENRRHPRSTIRDKHLQISTAISFAWSLKQAVVELAHSRGYGAPSKLDAARV